MRWLSGLMIVVALAASGCTRGSDDHPQPTPATTTAAATKPAGLASLDLDWPRAGADYAPGDHPAAPAGFDDTLLDGMAKTLVAWSRVATLDPDVWHSKAPIDAVAKALPAPTAATFEKQLDGVVSPRLAVANVFADDVQVVGEPQVTSAWKVSTAEDKSGEPVVLLQLQTRAAYEVRVGKGPVRVIGVLRVQGLSAYADTTDDYGVTGGWQEFGAGDCALALDDDFLPDADPAEATKDLKTFVVVGNGDELVMPDLGVDDQVDSEFLKRCRDGQV